MAKSPIRTHQWYMEGYDQDGYEHGLRGAPCTPPTLTNRTHDEDKEAYLEGYEKGQRQRLINILKK